MDNTVQIALQVIGGPAARTELAQTAATERSMVAASATATAQAAGLTAHYRAIETARQASMYAGVGRSLNDRVAQINAANVASDSYYASRQSREWALNRRLATGPSPEMSRLEEAQLAQIGVGKGSWSSGVRDVGLAASLAGTGLAANAAATGVRNVAGILRGLGYTAAEMAMPGSSGIAHLVGGLTKIGPLFTAAGAATMGIAAGVGFLIERSYRLKQAYDESAAAKNRLNEMDDPKFIAAQRKTLREYQSGVVNDQLGDYQRGLTPEGVVAGRIKKNPARYLNNPKLAADEIEKETKLQQMKKQEREWQERRRTGKQTESDLDYEQRLRQGRDQQILANMQAATKSAAETKAAREEEARLRRGTKVQPGYEGEFNSWKDKEIALRYQEKTMGERTNNYAPAMAAERAKIAEERLSNNRDLARAAAERKVRDGNQVYDIQRAGSAGRGSLEEFRAFNQPIRSTADGLLAKTQEQLIRVTETLTRALEQMYNSNGVIVVGAN